MCRFNAVLHTSEGGGRIAMRPQRRSARVDPFRTRVLESASDTVSVAKRLRRQVVALEIEGSNPFTHPIFPLLTVGKPLRFASADRAIDADPFRISRTASR